MLACLPTSPFPILLFPRGRVRLGLGFGVRITDRVTGYG